MNIYFRDKDQPVPTIEELTAMGIKELTNLHGLLTISGIAAKMVDDPNDDPGSYKIVFLAPGLEEASVTMDWFKIKFTRQPYFWFSLGNNVEFSVHRDEAIKKIRRAVVAFRNQPR